MAILLTLLSLACAILGSSASCFAETYSTLIRVEQRNHTVGAATYDFTFYIQQTEGPAADLSVTSPTGTVYQEPVPGSPYLDVRPTGLSLKTLNDNFLGDWMFEETLNGVTKSYLIALPEIQGSLFDIPVPIILSPADGATVEKVFDMTWTNAEPSSASYTYSSPISLPPIIYNGPGHYTFDFGDLDDSFPVSVTDFRIVKRLSERAINVTPLSANADSNFSGSHLRLAVHSPSISFTVVPEPTSMMLLGITIVFAIGSRRFYR